MEWHHRWWRGGKTNWLCTRIWFFFLNWVSKELWLWISHWGFEEDSDLIWHMLRKCKITGRQRVAGGHRLGILSCKAGRPPRLQQNHFSQFIISYLFHWLNAAGARVAVTNWTASYAAHSGGWRVRSFSHTFSAVCHVSSFYPAPLQEHVIHVAACS